MEIKTRKERKFLINNKKHFKKKQNTFLQFGTLLYYRNRRIGLHHKNNTLTRKRINNIHVKNHESDRTEL